MQGGAGLYAARIPERWKPGAFDVAFNSHQILHVAVIVAALVHYRVSLTDSLKHDTIDRN